MNRQSEPPVIPLEPCAACGAHCEVGQTKCWLCHGDPRTVPTQTSHAAQGLAQNSPLDTVFWVLLAICFGLAVLVAFGLAAEDPGFLIPYAIVVGPAFLVPSVRALSQIGRGERPQAAKFLLNAAVTFVATIGVIILLVVAGVALLFLICLSSLAGM